MKTTKPPLKADPDPNAGLAVYDEPFVGSTDGALDALATTITSSPLPLDQLTEALLLVTELDVYELA